RFTCRLCSECDIGCNYGSKNTLDYNYLSRALRAGADVRDCAEVRTFRPKPGGGWEVQYVEHDPAAWEGRTRDTRAMPLRNVTATRLIPSAGAVGSTYLLLKNRDHLPGISSRLGTSYSTNGDILAFALRCRRDGGSHILDPSFGPVITSTVEVLTGPSR